ncbi:hypothetical protein, conserved [Eimeria praecox]|uniref:Uncharacterized protein n=1 Tax=Eimeria praecox TaxID=51316 RepID=U6GYN4_9EIME|nr:hypothetical protein, conserved [Eimeria praecox]
MGAVWGPAPVAFSRLADSSKRSVASGVCAAAPKRPPSLIRRLDAAQGRKEAAAPAASSAAGNRPCYVLFNGDPTELDPEALLVPNKAAAATTDSAAVAQSPFRVFSFWHHAGAALSPPAQQRLEAAAAPVAPSKGANHTPAAAAAAAAAAEEETPVVLHVPAVPGGWARQTDAEALERTAIAGAAAACGDLLLLPLSLGDLEGPRSLLPQQQPLPILFSALQLQLLLRTLQQQDSPAAAPLSVAAAANRTKPLVLLLQDPVYIKTANERTAGAAEATAATAAEVETAETAVEALRVAAADAALRLLEDQWKAVAHELGMNEPAGQQQEKEQQQQQEQQQQEQQQYPADERMPALRDLFSVHIVFLPRPKMAQDLSLPPLAALAMKDKAELQRLLHSLLSLHRARDMAGTVQKGQSQQQQQQGLETDRERAGGSSKSALLLFEEAAAACRALLAAPEASVGSSGSPVSEEAPGATAAAAAKLSAAAALEFDAEVYRRELLAKFQAALGEIEGPQEGFELLQRLLEDFDKKCEWSAKQNAAARQRGKQTDDKPDTETCKAVIEIRQALEREAVKDLRGLHRLQLEALRVLSARRFELLLQQMLASKADPQQQQQRNPYDVANRVSGAVLQTANNLQQFIRDHHRAMGPEATRKLLQEEPEVTQHHKHQQQQGQRQQEAADARELLEAVERLAAEERLLLLKSLRGIAATALQQQELLQLQQQRQAGLGPLHRLQRKAVNRFLATAPGRATLGGLRRLSSATAAAAAHVGQLPLVRPLLLLLQPPLAKLWRNRKPVDVSLHYLSPTAFGLSPVR